MSRSPDPTTAAAESSGQEAARQSAAGPSPPSGSAATSGDNPAAEPAAGRARSQAAADTIPPQPVQRPAAAEQAPLHQPDATAQQTSLPWNPRQQPAREPSQAAAAAAPSGQVAAKQSGRPAQPDTTVEQARSVQPETSGRPDQPGRRSPGWLRDLAGAWIFYSVLPAWSAVAPRFQRIARFAPWIGAVLGSLQALLWWLLEDRVPLLAQVCLVLATGLLLSGGLHMDGAMDTADGLAAGERLLEAMRDSRVGASGAQALALLLLLRAAALAALGALAPGCLVWSAVWGRMAPLLAMARFPYLHARGTAGFHRRHWAGLAAELRPSLLLLAALLALVWLLPAGQGLPPDWQLPVIRPLARPAAGLLLGLPGALPAIAVPLWLGRRLGGHSGDSYGACVEWTETLALLLMAALAVVLTDQAGSV